MVSNIYQDYFLILSKGNIVFSQIGQQGGDWSERNIRLGMLDVAATLCHTEANRMNLKLLAHKLMLTNIEKLFLVRPVPIRMLCCGHTLYFQAQEANAWAQYGYGSSFLFLLTRMS